MDPLNIICYLCNHEFKHHNQGELSLAWWCDVGNCGCDEFVPKKDEQRENIQEQFKADTFRYN